MIVVAILTIIAIAASGSWKTYSVNSELDSNARNITDMLRRAQNNAVTGESFTAWGVHFENGADDFYQMFSGASFAAGVKTDYASLSSQIIFTTPSEASYSDIVFTQRTGTISSATAIVIRSSSNSSLERTISISTEGKMYID